MNQDNKFSNIIDDLGGGRLLARNLSSFTNTVLNETEPFARTSALIIFDPALRSSSVLLLPFSAFVSIITLFVSIVIASAVVVFIIIGNSLIFMSKT